MKKVFKLRDLDCANCARKMEDAIRKIDGVQNASINLITERLSIEYEGDVERILHAAAAACKKIESDAVLHIV